MNLRGIFSLIPEVTPPEEKKLSFKVKLKWTLIILATFFILANISLFGITANALERFEYLAIILGTDFGSIISLGIGPIVMASIILQLLTGAGIINIDTTTVEGKKFFQGLQKILVFFFIIFEASVYVFMNGLEAAQGFVGIVIFQLILGGLAIFYMNELCEKWGFGSGVSLFIAAGVSWRLISSAFQFIDQQGTNCLLDFAGTPCSGKVLVLIQSVITRDSITLLSAIAALVVTVLIFLAVVWAQSLKVEIPLSYGRIRGYSVKWPLSFFYANVIPVILAAALVANLQLFGGILENWLGQATFLGHFVNGQAVSGLSFWLGSTNILDLAIRGGLLPAYLLQGLIHIIVFSLLCMMFSIFWVKSSSMDAKAQAGKIASSGLQVAGFRQDIRILESILERYVMPLTVMGGIAIGLLASFTNLLGALVSGTAILLVIMIMFQLYQNIAQQHMTDMNPALRKFMGGGGA
ncbi:MAG: preprotein translocase subunit SecY [archaeon]|nr:preprotein translocase subunit SecY [archaeon]